MSFDNPGNCIHPVWKASNGKSPEDRAEATILIINKVSYASFGSLGTISYISPAEAALSATTFSDNTRFLYLDGRSVAEHGSLSSYLVAGFTPPKLSTVAPRARTRGRFSSLLPFHSV